MESFIASIMMFGFNFQPRGWMYCDGRLLPIAQYTAVFSLLGTTFGGNGQTTFGLPDFRGRVPVGMGQGPGLPMVNWGEVGGTPSMTLTINQMPAHIHLAATTAGVSSSNPTSDEAAGNVLANTATNFYAGANTVSGNLGGVSTTIQPAGGSQPFDMHQPYLGTNYCICMEGIFPSRN